MTTHSPEQAPSHALIVGAAKTIDQQGCMADCLAREQRLQQLGFDLHPLVIEPLSADWHAPEAPDHFRSGCAPIEALRRATELLASGTAAVVISGEDNLRSDYRRDERLRRMAVYGADYPLTEAYTDLARHFIDRHGVDAEGFRQLSAALFENHQRSYRNTLADDTLAPPAERWLRPVTELFRGVDCANPLIDFSGRLLLCTPSVADALEIPASQRVRIAGVAARRLPGDGAAYIEQIATYTHLRAAYTECCDVAAVDFAAQFRRGNALLEAYTCYPVVPMAFLLASGLVDLLEEIPDFVARHSLTVTGGMNLARAPWNNPALNALISMHHRLLQGPEQYGMVQGNGGLGYRQGVALLARQGG